MTTQFQIVSALPLCSKQTTSARRKPLRILSEWACSDKYSLYDKPCFPGSAVHTFRYWSGITGMPRSWDSMSRYLQIRAPRFAWKRKACGARTKCSICLVPRLHSTHPCFPRRCIFQQMFGALCFCFHWRHKLTDMHIESGANRPRRRCNGKGKCGERISKLHGMEDMEYLKEAATTDLIRVESWLWRYFQ